MKISNIEINAYNQFKNFAIDLTYPKGHEYEGSPLKKVCFIGQSGTGKTTLLNLIRAIVSHGLIEKSYVNKNMKNIIAETHFDEVKINRHIKIEDGNVFETLDKIAKKNTVKVKEENRLKLLLEHYSDSNILISFPAELITDFDVVLKDNKIEDNRIFQKVANEKQQEEIKEADKLKFKFFDFEINNVKEIWDNILKDIQEFKISQLSYRDAMMTKLENGMMDPDKMIEELKEWKKQHPNPLNSLADKLNLILKEFYLEIRKDPDFKKAEDLKFIKVHQIDGTEEIPTDYWSTGTKQLVLTATPLMKLNTDKSIVLIDEPERSFYPNIQQKIIDFYTKLAPNAQFFVATHSPIIASSFEPWEIVELKFNENGELKQDLYYKGERHVDNYFIQPQYLRWDSILNKIFDLEYDGNPARQIKLSELSEKGLKLKQMKEQGNINPTETKKLWDEYKAIAEMLDWKIDK